MTTRSTPKKNRGADDEIVVDSSSNSTSKKEGAPQSDTKSSGANVPEDDASDYDIDDYETDYDYDADELEALEEAAGISRQSVALLDVETRIRLLKKRGSAKLLTKPLAQRRASVGGKWNESEDASLREIVQKHGPKNWKKIAGLLGDTRTDVQCLHRWNKVLKPGLHKGSWLAEEDQIVREMVNLHGVGNVKWSLIAARLPGRIGKQCRERWFNHLDPAIVKVDWASDEDVTLFEAQRHFGNRWCEISKILPGRTENAVKNRWNSSTMKKWLKDNSLVPGPGTPLQDLSLEGMHRVLVSFCDTLAKKNVHMEYDTVAEMLGLGDLLIPGGGQLVNSIGSDGKNVSGLLRKGASEKGKAKGKSSSSSNQPGPSPSSTITSVSIGLPAHLRPSLINTNFDSSKSDDTTKQIIEMLHQLKSTPSPQNADNADTGRKRRSKLKIVDSNFVDGSLTKKRAKKDKDAVFEAFPDLLDDWSVKNAAGGKEKCAKKSGRGSRGGRGGRGAVRNGQHFFQTEDNLPPDSPTVKAWYKIMNSLRVDSSQDDSVNDVDMPTDDLDEQTPLLLVPYYKFLGESAQKSIIRQLIERFQRTSCTPRNAILPTPKFEAGGADGINDFLSLDYLGALGTPRFGAVDPNCFELEYGDIMQSGAQWSGSNDQMPPPSPMGAPTHNLLGNSSNATSDETAVDATVMIVLQIVNKWPSSDQLLKALLQGSGVGNEVPGLTPHNSMGLTPLTKSIF